MKRERGEFDFELLRAVKQAYTFDLGKVAGKGTFGYVTRATSTLGKRVAIKRFRQVDDWQKSAASEINAINALKGHPNVIEIIEVMTNATRDALFMVMEEAQSDLSHIIFHNENWLISEGQLKGYALQMFEALAFCHSHQIMHRDVKPENLLVMRNNVVKLADFGLCARKPDDWCVVTQWYRAPELLLHSKCYDYAIDVWAAGVVVVEMLGGANFITGDEGEDPQCQATWAICGSPVPSQWPAWAQQRIRETVKQPHDRTLREKLLKRPKRFKEQTIHFIDNLLTLLPEARMTAAQALKHPYFAAYEKPLKPEQMTNHFKNLKPVKQTLDPQQERPFAHNLVPKRIRK